MKRQGEETRSGTLSRRWRLPMGAPQTLASGIVLLLVMAACTQAVVPDEDDETGTLVVVISGLPNGVAADVDVTGPGLDQVLGASQTFSDIAVGSYSVTAAAVSNGAEDFAAKVTGSPATVQAGGTATVTVEYIFLDPALVGTLQVDISGLPAGTDAAVNVSGPGFDQDLTASTTLDDLIPANYAVTATDVSDGTLTYAAEVESSPALVLPEETTTVTVTYRPFVPDDGDAASNPGLFALFRATSGNPVTVNELLFNEADPLDVKGLQLVNELGDPEDTGDWLAFELVHGESPTSSVEVNLDCDTDFTPGSPIRVELRDDEGTKIGSSLTCDNSLNFAIPADGGSGDYLLHVISHTTQPYYVAYTLSVDAYCFQACTYEPLVP